MPRAKLDPKLSSRRAPRLSLPHLIAPRTATEAGPVTIDNKFGKD